MPTESPSDQLAHQLHVPGSPTTRPHRSWHNDVVPRRALVGSLLILSALSAACQANAQEFQQLPQDLEIELALSALPEDLQADATVYVRDPSRGFVLHRAGRNGWTTFVARTSVRFYDAQWDYERYPSDQLIPQAHDAVGLANHVVPYFDLEKMRIEGVSPQEAKRILRQRFNDGTYAAPTQGGMSYMLAPIHRAYSNPANSSDIQTYSFPHHMPYAPHVDATRMGTLDPLGRVGVLDHGGTDSGPHGYFYLMVQPDQADAIRKRYAPLLDRLCALHAAWCLG